MNRTPVTDWQQLSALYELADTLAPDSLEDWLAQLRRQAHPLLAQLEQMLLAREQIRENGFLGTLPKLPVSPQPGAIEWQAGSRIGPYRLLRKVGTGGMAEVWLAQRDDGAFQRQVAIKLLFRNRGSDQRDSFAQRFARERDILASLHHPHIAGLHDAGVTPTGQPWLALEYVEGQTLTSWCNARNLTIEARVRLFRQVLLAVQHAHANLVIHRDLKPGNILVTAQGEVRLLDFGIAKLMEPEGGALPETELTRIAGRPMTLQYASPEQLMGQPLTTACDVYSLGVVLYELLCGERPYELKVDSAAQLEQAILDTEPRAPSRRALAEPIAIARGTTGALLRRQLASDLDAITLRALAKQPAQRYGSVEALGADLDRWLGGEPVEARTPSTAYRVGKFVRRHTLSVSLGVGAVVALVGVAAVAVVMGYQARQESARAVASRDFMLSLFQHANQEKSHGADITARDLLDTGRRDVVTRLVGQPQLQADLLQGIAKIQGDMGEFVTADHTFSDLERIYSVLHRPREEAMVKANRAFNFHNMNDPESAARQLRAAFDVRGRPVDDPELNARLAEVSAWLALNRGEIARARELLTTAIATARQALGEDHLRTFRLEQALFRAERDDHQTDSALALLGHLRQSAQQIGDFGADEVAAMDWEEVNLLYGAGQFATALSRVETARPRCIEALGAQSQACRYLTIKRGQLLLRLGRIDMAPEVIASLKPITDDPLLPFLQIEALMLELRLRSQLANDGRSRELAESFDRVRKFGQAGTESHVQSSLRAGALLGLAESCLRVGDPVQARYWVNQALGAMGVDAHAPVGSRTQSNAQMLFGISLLEQGEAAGALAAMERSEAYLSKALGAQHPVTSILKLNKAMALAANGRVEDAVLVVKQAQAILRGALGPDTPAYGQTVQLMQKLELEKQRPVRVGTDSKSLPAAVPDWGRSARGFFGG